MRRFFVPRDAVAEDQVMIRGTQAHHMAVVLRLQPGERVIVFDGSQVDRVVELERVAPEQVTGRIVESRPGLHLGIALTLVQGIPKGTKMDDVVRMGTELGVAEFLPVHTRRTVAEARHRAARWRRIAIEAAKQSRRSDVPQVHEPVHLGPALDAISGHDLILLLWEGERQQTIAQALVGAGMPGRVAVIVGPEGGLESAEVEEATRHGAIPVSLGSLVLRTETAGIVALSMVLYELALRKVVTRDS